MGNQRFPGGLFVEKCEYGWTIYRGTKAQLLAAGAIKDELLPDEPGAMRRHSMNSHAPCGRRCCITRLARKLPQRYQVTVYPTNEERRAIDAREELRKAKSREEAALSRIPNCADRYREIAAASVIGVLRVCVESFLEQGIGGYRLAPAAMNEFNRAVEALVGTIRCGEVEYDAAYRAWEIAQIKADTVKADPAAQRFMQQAIGNIEQR